MGGGNETALMQRASTVDLLVVFYEEATCILLNAGVTMSSRRRTYPVRINPLASPHNPRPRRDPYQIREPFLIRHLSIVAST